MPPTSPVSHGCRHCRPPFGGYKVVLKEGVDQVREERETFRSVVRRHHRGRRSHRCHRRGRCRRSRLCRHCRCQRDRRCPRGRDLDQSWVALNINMILINRPTGARRTTSPRSVWPNGATGRPSLVKKYARNFWRNARSSCLTDAALVAAALLVGSVGVTREAAVAATVVVAAAVASVAAVERDVPK